MLNALQEFEAFLAQTPLAATLSLDVFFEQRVNGSTKSAPPSPTFSAAAPPCSLPISVSAHAPTCERRFATASSTPPSATLQREMSLSQFYDEARRVRSRLPHRLEPKKPLLCIADQGAVVGLDVLVWTKGTTGVKKRVEKLESMLAPQCANCNVAVHSRVLMQDMGECEDCGVALKSVLWCEQCCDYTCQHCWEMKKDEMRKQLSNRQKRQWQSPSGGTRERQRRSPSGSGSGRGGHQAAATHVRT